MRARWLCIGLGCAAGLAAACGDGAHGGSTQPAGGGGNGSGGVAGALEQGGRNAAAGRGGAGGAGGAGDAGGEVSASGTSGSSGAGGSEMSGAGGGASGLGGGSSASGTGGAGLEGGQANAAGDSAGGDGSAGTSTGCAAADPDKLVFVSSVLYTGNLAGLAGADAKCQGLADAAGLCGSFKAWLSDATGNAAAHLSHASGNYLLPSGQIVANGWAGLTSGTLLHAIDLTETKAPAPVGTVSCGGSPQAPVWTGATFSGVAAASGSCSNWSSTSTSIGGVFGNALATNAAWSGMCQLLTVCASSAALYCIQQ